jgi:signal peptidase II
MNNIWRNKWAIFGLVMVLGTVVDQWSKLYAESRLATISRDWQKELVLTPDADVPKLRDYLREELSWSTDAEVNQIAARFTFSEKGRPLHADSPVKQGEPLHIKRRTATVIEGYFDFMYARNPGAAWSFMADQPEWLRKSFFRIASLLALGLIITMLVKTTNAQWRMIWGLSFVASGAVGNFIDRLAYGYVIDFIVWHIDDSYWPTFNIADAWIAIGVGFMFLEFIFAPKEELPKDQQTQTQTPIPAQTPTQTPTDLPTSPSPLPTAKTDA